MNNEQRKKTRPVYKDTNLQIIFLITLMAVLGVSSITPAFPRITKIFNISSNSIGLLITVFTLPGVVLTPVLGVLADQWGRKKILIPSLFLFGLAGGAGIFATNFHVLLVFRFLQGVGAASLSSLNITIIGDLYSGKKRASAMGYNASVLSVGTASYPALGGALTLLGWNYPFLLPLIAIPVALLAVFKLDNPEVEKQQKFLIYLKSAWINIMDREVISLFLLSMFTFVILYGVFLTYFPFLVNKLSGSSSFIIGLIMSVMSASTAVTSSQLGRLNSKYSVRQLLSTAFILYGISLLLTVFVNNIWQLLVPTIIFGIGHGINIPSLQVQLTKKAPMKQRGAFMSINGMVLRLGQTLGPFVMGLVYGIWSLNGVFLIGTVIAVLMFVIYLQMKTR